jgi:hypothetical protein
MVTSLVAVSDVELRFDDRLRCKFDMGMAFMGLAAEGFCAVLSLCIL